MSTFSVTTQFTKAICAAKPIEFNPAWANGTGYFDHAVKGEHAPKLQQGEMVKSTDTIGRGIIMIGTLFGNVVVFQRHSENSDIYTGNYPLAVKQCGLVSTGAIQCEEMESIVGTYGDNIGIRIKNLIGASDKLRAVAEIQS